MACTRKNERWATILKWTFPSAVNPPKKPTIRVEDERVNVGKQLTLERAVVQLSGHRRRRAVRWHLLQLLLVVLIHVEVESRHFWMVDFEVF